MIVVVDWRETMRSLLVGSLDFIGRDVLFILDFIGRDVLFILDFIGRDVVIILH
jgi:hypothetical protein